MTAFDTYIQAAYHGGTMPGGPTFTVIHDAETPLRAGYADSIAEFFRKGPAAGTSAHAMVDPVKAIKLLPDNVVAYAAGPYANTYGWHLEQAGYARFSREEWLAADGLAQLQRVGACLREIHDHWGLPKRWMTDDQLRRAAKGDRASGGMTTHQQVARVLGGTTHTDPETNYPRDLLLQVVAASPEEPDLDADQNNRLTEAWTNSAAAKDNAAAAARLAQEAVNWVVDPNHGILKQLGDVARAVAASRDDVDEAALASAVAASLVPAVVAALASQGGLTEEQVRAATVAAVREVFADAAA